MKPSWILCTLLVAGSAQAQWSYPPTRTVTVVDTWHGKAYPDPYRWLEDGKSKEVEDWFKAQATLTDAQLDAIPGRDALVQEWLVLDKLKPATYADFKVAGSRVFFWKRLGGENVGKLYMRERWDGPEKLLFDPTTYQSAKLAQGSTTTMKTYSVSWDGKRVALALSSGGAEWAELRVLDVDKGTLLPESIYPSWSSAGWTPDNKAFFYDAGKVTDIKSPDIELNRKSRLHVVGTDVASDREVLSNEVTPELSIEAKEWPWASIDEVWPDHVVASVMTVQNEMKIYVAPAAGLRNNKLTWRNIALPKDKLVRGFTFHGDDVYAITHAGAPHYKLVRTSASKPDWANAETVIPEAGDSMESLARSKNFIVVSYSNGITGRIVSYDLRTKKSAEIKLPAPGTVFSTCPDAHSDRCVVGITTWIAPLKLFDLDLAKGTLVKSVFNADVVYPGFDQLEVEEVEVPSHDGVMVPLSIIHKKGMKMDGSTPAVLEGYGAYGISYTPWFNVMHSLASHDVVFAYAHVRGGSEKGEAWYKAGYKSTKPNTWKDFIAAAEYLVKKGYTSPQRLGGTGTSAGGILISRAITERPDLFGAAVCNVCVANATRMEVTPNGPVNTPEFGTMTKEEEARALYEMDGVQHVKKGTKYPALLGVAGWNDPRVTAWETGKLVAAVQQASSSAKPALLKVNYDNGHFTEERLVTFKNFASQYAFLLWQCGHKDFQPKAKRSTGGAAAAKR